MLDYGRHYLKDIANNPIGGNLKNGRLPVLVDSDNDSGTLHPDQVLNSAADAAGYIKLRSNCLACLADLALRRHPASLYDSSRTAYHAIQLISQLLQHDKIIPTAHAPSAGYYHLRFSQVDTLPSLPDVFYYLQHLV